MSDTKTLQQGNPDQLLQALETLEVQMDQATMLLMKLQLNRKDLKSQAARTARSAGWLHEVLTEASRSYIAD